MATINLGRIKPVNKGVWSNSTAYAVDDFVQYKNGGGVDLVFEATNSPEGLNLSIHASNIGGKIIVVGIPDGDNYQFKASEARRRGISIKFSRRMGEVYDRTISMVEKGLVALDDLATHTSL